MVLRREDWDFFEELLVKASNLQLRYMKILVDAEKETRLERMEVLSFERFR